MFWTHPKKCSGVFLKCPKYALCLKRKKGRKLRTTFMCDSSYYLEKKNRNETILKKMSTKY
jgi:hypothetical protein